MAIQNGINTRIFVLRLLIISTVLYTIKSGKQHLNIYLNHHVQNADENNFNEKIKIKIKLKIAIHNNFYHTLEFAKSISTGKSLE